MAVTQAKIKCQRQLIPGVFHLILTGIPMGTPGQFVLLHLEETSSLLLPRPISLFDQNPQTGETGLVYRIAGRGTALLAKMGGGASLRVTGPLGNGFPLKKSCEAGASGDLTAIGGGLGIAPLYYLIKAKRAAQPSARVRVHLGYSGEPFLREEFAALGAELTVDVGGYVTDQVDFSVPGVYCACGPEPMMRAAAKKAQAAHASLYVSLEKRMGCGVGACLACSVPTPQGNRRVCKDGPVFPAQEVFFHE